ncbi:MAG: S41 family peptidase [Candidatus Methylacidiphilales bacterium]
MNKINYQKRFSILLLITFFSVFSGSSHADKNDANINTNYDSIYYFQKSSKTFKVSNFTPNGKLFYLAKIWGVLYYHPILNSDNVDLSDLENKSKISNVEFKNYVSKLFEKLIINEKFKHFIETKEDSLLHVFTLINNEWLNDTTYINNDIALKIKYLQYGLNGKANSENTLSQSENGLIEYNNPLDVSNNDFPDENLRLAGLFHYWNFINYFYPYKNMIDKNWDEVLFVCINDFLVANNKISYGKAILKLIANLDDNNSKVSSTEDLTSIFGNYVPNFRIRKIDNNYYISTFRAKDLDSYGLKIGDKIISLNGTKIEKLDSLMRPFLSGGNPESKQREINKFILVNINEYNGIEILRNNKLIKKQIQFYNYAVLKDASRMYEKDWENKTSVVWYPNNIAYLNMNHLFENNFDRNAAEILNSSGYILDMRGFHNDGVAHKIIELLTKKTLCEQSSIYPDVYYPGVLKSTSNIPKVSDSIIYKNKVVLIVDESTQGHAEYVVEIFKNKLKTKIIGNTTAGSSGEVASFVFPGNVKVELTGVGINYCNKSTLQRVGVELDSTINYNAEYLEQGRDIMIETALKIAASK